MTMTVVDVYASADVIARSIAAGEVSAVEVAQAHLDRIAEGGVALIAGSSGYGKSSAVAAWASRSPQPTRWIRASTRLHHALALAVDEDVARRVVEQVEERHPPQLALSDDDRPSRKDRSEDVDIETWNHGWPLTRSGSIPL